MPLYLKDADTTVLGDHASKPQKGLEIDNSSGDVRMLGNLSCPKPATFSGGTRLGSASNYVSIDGSGNVSLNGDAAAWKSVRISGMSMQAGSTPPDVVSFGAGEHVLKGFDKSTRQYLTFDVPLPETYKEGSSLYPNVHWTSLTVGEESESNVTVRWGLTYNWANVDSAFETSDSTAYGNGDILVAKNHEVTSLGEITGTGKGIASILTCSLSREADHEDDTHDADALLLHIDFNFRADSIGSTDEYVK